MLVVESEREPPMLLEEGGGAATTDLLKKRGMRMPSDREVDAVLPKVGVPPCCRGIEM